MLFHEARAKVLLKQPVKAIALVGKACANQILNPQQKAQVNQFLREMAVAGQLLEGYRAAPDKVDAFRTLTMDLVYRKKDQELAALLEEHARGRQEDPLVQFYTGELHLLRGDAKQAETHFAAALARNESQEHWQYRQGLFRARVKLGKVAATYQEMEPGTTTFEALANLCLQEKDAKQLQALIDAHRKVRPDDPNLPGWDIEVKWLSKDHEGVVRQLTERRQEHFALTRFRWKFNDYLVRGLVKTKRGKEAIQEAEAMVKAKKGDQMLLILAHASAGDVKQTIGVVAKLKPHPYFLGTCYRDADLGPILGSEAFRAFRDKYPEPKDEVGKEERDRDER